MSWKEQLKSAEQLLWHVEGTWIEPLNGERAGAWDL